ncbi:MAG: DNA-binding NtrC family response regulator [Motiliproteus sp.]|jgi:DNA-binding NtrC family response regulator
MESRSVLFLRYKPDDEVSRHYIEDAGWHSCAAFDAVGALEVIKNSKPKVGLVYFDRHYLNGGSPELEKLFQSTSSIEWVGLIKPENLSLNNTRLLIASYLSDYHTLPIDNRRLLNSLGHAYGMANIREALSSPLPGSLNGHRMIAVSTAMDQVFKTIARVAAVDASVMISGESGTGKELAAHAIHNKSRRASKPFIAVNCGSIHSSLIQTELFGHEKGSFSGAHKRHVGKIESADGGTLFLDEIGDLPLELQVNFLRFLQEKTINRVGGSEQIPVDVRVITATHKDLDDAVLKGEFREDLYYRLHVLALALPSLRDRKEDIEPLAQYFLHQFESEANHRIRGFSRAAIQSMYAYDWPGNVRELINRVERAVVMSEGALISPGDLDFNSESQARPVQTLAQTRAEADRAAIESALRCSGHNVTEAARLLGVSRVTLYRLMNKFEINAKQL